MTSTSATERPPAFIHVDCDGVWAVRSCYGPAVRPEPQGDPFWREGLPAALELFASASIPATFFIIGCDLDVPAQRELALEAHSRGHELANHSHTHRLDLGRASPQAARDEILRAQSTLEQVMGAPALGFRAPGFSWRPELDGVLADCGLVYDSSTFASPWGPALRLARRVLGRGEAEHHPYGPLRSGFRCRGIHAVGSSGRLLRLPVSLSPRLRLPVHASFALLRGDAAFRRAVEWHARRQLPFIWLIHLIDLCDTRDLVLSVPGWSQRAFRRGAEEKRQRLARMLAMIQSRFAVQRTDLWVQSELNRLAQPGDGKCAA